MKYGFIPVRRLSLVGRVWGVVLLGMSLVLQACGGGSGGGVAAPVAAASDGQLLVGIRDSAGDFLSYTVDVTSLRLERANGAVVETIPLSTRIDFAQLADLTEFFTAATVPSGAYSRIVVNLDFSNASIVVQDDAGAAVPVVAVDSDGKALTTLAVTIALPGTEPVRIAPGVPAAITLDFDLDASNTIDLASNPAKVMVQPFLSVIPILEIDRAHRVRGVLASVDTAVASVTLKVRPFHVRQGEFGRLTFATNDRTRWEINGDRLVGAAGLTALAALAIDTPVVAQGTVRGRTLTAATVLAGSSVPWANGNFVTGVVTARQADTLTVKGANIDFANGTAVFRGSFTVLVGDNTRVKSLDVEPGTLNKGAISIGQRIVAFGAMTDAATLDATAGRVRLEISGLAGTVVQSNPLVVNLSELGGLRPGAFDFRGTGDGAANDSDPTRYEIDTSTLALPSVSPNDLVGARGLVHAFGAAPPDFDARTVIDLDTQPNVALFWASWRAVGGSANPFSSLSADRIDVDLTQARHLLEILGMPRGGNGSDDRIALIAPDNVRGVYLVAVRGGDGLHLFSDFAELTRELSDQLAAGNRLVQIHANGRYNAGTLELATPRASFEFRAP